MANITISNLEEIMSSLELIKREIGEIKVFSISAAETRQTMLDICCIAEKIKEKAKNTIDIAAKLQEEGLIP